MSETTSSRRGGGRSKAQQKRKKKEDEEAESEPKQAHDKEMADAAASSSSSSVAASAPAPAPAANGSAETKEEKVEEEEEEEVPKKKKGKKEKAPSKPKQQKAKPAYKFNVNKCLDKAHEGKFLADIIQLPPSALEGLTPKADELLSAFGIKTIAQLADWKYYHLANALSVMASLEETGNRDVNSTMNINKALDKAYEIKPLKDIVKSSPACLQGLAAWADDHLASLRIKTVKDLANWKFPAWAHALVTLAAYESSDHSSA